MRAFVGLVYHDVHPDNARAYGRMSPSALMYHVSRATFGRHLALIARSGTHALGIAALRRPPPLPPPAAGNERGVALCFDDGWEGAVTRAAAALELREWPAFFFITTGFIGRPHFATAAQLRRLDPRLFTIGSHGVTHRMLSRLAPAEIRAELAVSQRVLEDLLGVPVRTLSIPGGAVDRRVVEIARELGYTAIFTSTIGVNPTAGGSYDIARIGVTRTTSDARLGRWLAFRLGPERWRKAALALPKRLLGMRAYTRVRRALLGDRGHEHHFEP
ncbi:MAG: polysaccharide deacetylase family protein [Gemmatimonadales bacterium]